MELLSLLYIWIKTTNVYQINDNQLKVKSFINIWRNKHLSIVYIIFKNNSRRPTFPITKITHLPTKFSKTELFPADCPPTTAIWGKSNVKWTPNCVKASCNLFTIGISCSMPVLPAIFFNFTGVIAFIFVYNKQD